MMESSFENKVNGKKEELGKPLFAKAIFDSSFKHMLQDPAVRLSFLRVFTGRSDIIEVEDYPTAVPALRSLKKSQRHMDFACRVKGGDIFIAEVQIQKHDYWSARALYYAASVYSQQIEPGDLWGSLQNVVAINIVDYKTGSLEPGDFERCYVMMDMLHQKDMWPYLKILQFELPRVNFSLILDKEKREWLKILKESATMEKVPEDFGLNTARALQRLELSRWKGGLMAQHRNEEKWDIKNYSIVIGETFEEGKQEGLQAGMIYGQQKGLAQGKHQGIREGSLQRARECASRMLQAAFSLKDVVQITGLSEKEVLNLQRGHY